jgi:hypothetical protein
MHRVRNLGSLILLIVSACSDPAEAEDSSAQYLMEDEDSDLDDGPPGGPPVLESAPSYYPARDETFYATHRTPFCAQLAADLSTAGSRDERIRILATSEQIVRALLDRPETLTPQEAQAARDVKKEINNQRWKRHLRLEQLAVEMGAVSPMANPSDTNH